MDLELVALAMAIGIAVEAPLGPVNLIVIRASLRGGLIAGIAASLGSILGEGIFAAATAYGFTSVGDFIRGYAVPLQIAGGILLVAMGINTYRRHVSDKALREQGQERREPLWHRMLMTFVLTITNPATFMGMVAIIGSMGPLLKLANGSWRPLVAVGGVMAGALAWWLFVAWLASHLRRRLTGAMLDQLNHWAGIAIMIFGIAVLINVAVR